MSRILVVDDEESIRLTLATFLGNASYEVETAEDVPAALKQLKDGNFDVVVSDIVMPRVTGLELLQTIRQESPRVQVIMMTGQPTVETAAATVRAGAFDYLFKPVPKDAILRCVANAAKLKATEDARVRLQRELEQQNIYLDEQVRLRTRQLAEANARLSILDKAKSDFLGLISHELRTPLNGLFGVADLLLADCPPNPAATELTEIFQQSRLRLLTIIEDALLLTQIEVGAGRFSPKLIPLSPILRLAVQNTDSFAKNRNVLLETVPDDPCLVRGEAKLFAKAIQALLETAVKFSRPGETVRLSRQSTGADVVLLIDARGRTIPTEALPRFFQVFSIKEPITPGGDLGLGPPVAERIISLFGGGVVVENLEPPGIRLTVCLKTAYSVP